MAGLERDPNALAALLNMQPQIPQHTEEDYALQSMIPQEDLYQAQESIADQGRARGGPYAVPSRESLQQSGMSKLRQLFGLAEAQAKALPAHITGEYGMANRRLQNQGALDVANVNQAGAAERETGLNTRATAGNLAAGERAALGQTGMNERSAAGRASAERIAGANRTGRSDVAAANQAATTARKNPPGALSSILQYFGIGKPEEAVAPSAISPNVTAAITSARQDPSLANLTFEDLLSSGRLEGASPQEIAEFQAAW